MSKKDKIVDLDFSSLYPIFSISKEDFQKIMIERKKKERIEKLNKIENGNE